MYILDGAVTMTIEDETRTLEAGDTVVVNRGLEHELHSEHGVTFMEALAPVPLDHVPDRDARPRARPRRRRHARRALTREEQLRRWPTS